MKVIKKTSFILTGILLVLLCWYLGTLVTPQELQEMLLPFGRWAAAAYIGLFTLLPAFFFPVAVLALRRCDRCFCANRRSGAVSRDLISKNRYKVPVLTVYLDICYIGNIY